MGSKESELKEIYSRLDIGRIRYRQQLILSALRNILNQINKNGINDYLISQIEREL